MNKRALVFVFIIAALIIFSGILALSLNSRNIDNEYTGENKEIITSQYLISTPSYGPLIRLQNIIVNFEGDKAIGTLPDETAKAVTAPQKVVLYDKAGFAQPLGGVVVDIEPAENSLTKITIQLPEGTNTDLLLNEPDIITLETIASKRLPKSALVNDAAGKDYIWIATPTAEDKTAFTLQQLYIDVGLDDLDYFEEGGFKISATNFVILNPDDKLDANKTYRFKEVQMNASLHNPIKQAWVDFELNRLNQQQKKMQEAVDNCGKVNAVVGDLTTAPDVSTPATSDSCGADFLDGGATDPFAIFNSLINQQE